MENIEKALNDTHKAKRIAKRKKNIFIICMLIFPVLQFLIFFVYININTVLMTFERVNWVDYTIERGLYNWKRLGTELIGNPEIQKAIVNSLWVFVSTDFVLLPLSVLFGYYIYKKVFMSGFFRSVFFLPSVISIVVMTMVFQFMFSSSFGPINSLLEMAGIPPENIPVWFGEEETALFMVLFYSVWVGIGFNIVLLNGAISRLPKDILEYGKLEGVGMTRELLQLIVPMIWPTITTLAVMGATSIFTMFLPVQLLTDGGPNGASATIAFYINNMVQGAGVQLEWAATLGILFSLIGIPLIFGLKTLMEKVGEDIEF